MSTKVNDAKTADSLSPISLDDAKKLAPRESALRELLDRLPRSEGGLWVATYRYGDTILEKGVLVPPASSKAPKEPLLALAGLLEGTAEVYMRPKVPDEVEQALGFTNHPLPTLPIRVLGRGELFGVFEVLDAFENYAAPVPIWEVSAGTRSVQPLFNITGDVFLKAISRATTSPVPKEVLVMAPWKLIEYVCPEAAREWRVRLLILPNAWRSNCPSDARSVLYRLGWQQSRYLRESAVREMDVARRLARYKASSMSESYLSRTLVYLNSIAAGEAPAMVRVDDSSTGGPFGALQTALVEKKLIRGFHPAMIQPAHLAPGQSGYYSIRWPSIAAWRIAHQNLEADAKIIADLYEKLFGASDVSVATKDEKNELTRSKADSATDQRDRHHFLSGCLRVTRANR